MTALTYRVMVSSRGTSTIISIHDLDYPAMVQSGNYTEVKEGTKKECEDYQSEMVSELTIED